MKQCPFNTTAVQAQAARLVDKGSDPDLAIKSARSTFGACDGEECQMWCSMSKEFADKHGFDPDTGWCGLVNEE